MKAKLSAAFFGAHLHHDIKSHLCLSRSASCSAVLPLNSESLHFNNDDDDEWDDTN